MHWTGLCRKKWGGGRGKEREEGREGQASVCLVRLLPLLLSSSVPGEMRSRRGKKTVAGSGKRKRDKKKEYKCDSGPFVLRKEGKEGKPGYRRCLRTLLTLV